ncbi:MAG: ATP-binding cassette domain-containing protein [Candidatus Hydrogenedens sp.]|nr:ATP-binding cassette domain-containing protein [Candidatus Hydrogenedens sp.]
MTPLLEVENLQTHFPITRGVIFSRSVATVRAVENVSLQLHAGKTLGLVGESGCGKSTLARTIVGLAPKTGGTVRFEGKALDIRDDAFRRGVQMVFQDPYASLNPRMTVYSTLAEPLLVHGICAKNEVPARVAELMDSVGLASRHVRKYPHEFSGGQRQRIAIARALALEPRVIIADEPVSALDVSVQAQVLNLLRGLSRERQLAMLLISHDLGVVRHMADEIAVMYLGRIVEQGPSEAVFESPKHPYTRALLDAIPMPDPVYERSRQRVRLQGDPASPLNPPPGCAFHPRCAWAAYECRRSVPALEGEGHQAACLRQAEVAAGAPAQPAQSSGPAQ